MRLRRTAASAVATAVGALALVLSAPASAHAATGPFTYVVDGDPVLHLLPNPPSGTCVPLPEVADPEVPPAHSPRNFTDSTAVVFTGTDCTGDSFSLRPETGYGSERLKLRSVLFGLGLLQVEAGRVGVDVRDVELLDQLGD
ncbi:hypothetical protein AB0D04_18250, partial [Streptomyces sp. NPDC048483]|uniref:hypothetical protein n=1 Tax=Streptomyces sp. NPDC048483 TaxID=3154927 RepID=UPI00341CA562